MRYLLAGHLCKDLIPDEGYDATTQSPSAIKDWRYGGTVLYGGIMAAQLGAETHILTRCNINAKQATTSMPDIYWHVLMDSATTTFLNTYGDEGRRQVMTQRANDIAIDPIIGFQPTPDIIHLAPVANEIALLPEQFNQTPDKSWLVATPQGWMREVDGQNSVQRRTWQNSDDILPYLKTLVLSDEDVEYKDQVAEQYAESVPVVLYTRGEKNATLFSDQRQYTIPAAPVDVVDLTGAGDVTATAFFIRFYETHNPLEAAYFAMMAAALSIQHVGASGIPSREDINKHLGTWPAYQSFLDSI